MRTKKYIISLTFSVVLLSQVSCKKEFLEIDPKGFVIARVTKDYEQLLNANYISSIFTASVYRGDEVSVMQPYFGATSIRVQRLFKYEDRVYEVDAIPNEMTDDNAYIRKLYLFNKVINEVMDSKEGTDEQKRALLAEAKVGRAICNFLFISDFAKPYNPSTAATDLGIPNLTQNDVTLTDFSRLRQKENYELMIKDISEALPDLGRLVHRRKISKLAGYFYLARIYLTMGDFAAAKKNLDLAFLEKDRSSIDLRLYDYTVVLNPEQPTAPGTWLPVADYSGPAGMPNAANNAQTIYNVGAIFGLLPAANALVYSPRTAALFDPKDRRVQFYSPLEIFGSVPFPRQMRRPVFTFNTDIGPVLADLYLMRAECRARENDLSAAVADVEELRKKRTVNYQVPLVIAGDQQALVRFILDERIREFAFTGLRWLDMRRLSVDPIYKDHIDFTHTTYSATGGVVNTYTLRPERFALKFGERMLRESSGLEENP